MARFKDGDLVRSAKGLRSKYIPSDTLFLVRVRYRDDGLETIEFKPITGTWKDGRYVGEYRFYISSVFEKL